MRIAIVEWEDAVAAKDNLGSWLHKDEFIVISQSILGDDVAENTKIPRVNIVRMIIVDESDLDKVGIKYVRPFETDFIERSE